MTYKLEPLPYEYNSLEPFIDEQTMKIHHDKHHQTYVDKLNAALEGHPDLQKKSAEDLIKDIISVPESIRTAVRNHGGGHVNHTFFWHILKKDVQPSGEILEAVNKKFGSLDKFKEEFTKAALAVFGSGWAWLVLNNGELEIMSTPNQDCPISHGKIPVLGVDMWEHSFYLKHKSNKAAYLEDFFHVINWNKVNEHYKKTKK